MNDAILLTHGMRNGSLTHISDVEKGAACRCVCPACQEPLVAKKGEIMQHHFAHAAGSDCAKSVETALHLAAKEILNSRREIVLPLAEVRFAGSHPSIILAEEMRYHIDDIWLENRVGSVVPDVLARINGKQVAIEIRVTHAVDEKKIGRLRELKLSTVEIDISHAPRDFSYTTLEPLIIDGGSHKEWAYNAAIERRHNAIYAAAKYMATVTRGFAVHVDGCPIPKRIHKGKPYANVTHDCICCRHAIDIGPNMSSVTCAGFDHEMKA